VQYCGRDCQRAHWAAGHRKTCRDIDRPSENHRLQLGSEKHAECKACKWGVCYAGCGEHSKVSRLWDGSVYRGDRTYPIAPAEGIGGPTGPSSYGGFGGYTYYPPWEVRPRGPERQCCYATGGRGRWRRDKHIMPWDRSTSTLCVSTLVLHNTCRCRTPPPPQPAATATESVKDWGV
jgi:hypothetical protein